MAAPGGKNGYIPEAHRLDSLCKAAEVAAGEMHHAAEDLEVIAHHLPGKDNYRREHLERTAARLGLAADLLIAEAQASSVRSAGLTASVGNKILRSAVPIVLAITGGIGTGVGQAAYDHFMTHQAAAVNSLDQVEIIVQTVDFRPPSPDQSRRINQLAVMVNETLTEAADAGAEVDFRWVQPMLSVIGGEAPLREHIANLELVSKEVMLTLSEVDGLSDKKPSLVPLFHRLETLMAEVLDVREDLENGTL